MRRKAGRSACPDFSGDVVDDGPSRKKNPNNRDFQFWQQNNEPIELNTNKLLDNTLHYTHYNPVEAGFVNKPEDRIYNSARDYAGEKGPLKIILLDYF
ncbi:MAG TPA: hypothetical protein PLD84_10360 [Chitinophagales bacterium]|nr:hypothetical protein [Chitinophagales bacterium]